MNRKVSTRALLIFMAGAAFSAAAADKPSYPNRPIRFIMPYPVGGTIDMSGRMVAQQLGENLGQQVVVDNRTGAGGTLGTELAAKSPPDGYTFVMGGTGTLAVSPGLGRPLGYHPLNDFLPITLLATTPYVLVAHPSVPAASVRELITLAKARPGQLNYASGGSGSAPHLIGEMFRTRVSPWFGVLVPAKTPPAIAARLNEEMVKVLRNPALRERLARDGVDTVGNTSREFGAFIRAEMEKWARAVKESGAKVE